MRERFAARLMEPWHNEPSLDDEDASCLLLFPLTPRVAMFGPIEWLPLTILATEHALWKR